MAHTIYQLRCVTSKKSYIGVTKNLRNRTKSHKDSVRQGSTLPIHAAMREFGWNNFKVIILEVVEDESQILNREGYWIQKLHTLTPRGYNVATQGSALPGDRHPGYGKIRSAEARAKISAGKKGLRLTPEHRLAIAAGLVKNPRPPLSAEARERIAASKRGKLRPDLAERNRLNPRKGVDNHNFGKIFSEEYRRKIGEATRKRWQDAEMRAKMSKRASK